jgi:hypothetical protein
MDKGIQRQLRYLKAYAVISSASLAALFFMAATQGTTQPAGKARFQEIDVERINILEADGTLRLSISNNGRSPGPVIGGLTLKTREGKRGAGLIFFNDKGDECGGMTWSGKGEGEKASANGGIMFDQYNSDQIVGIRYGQRGQQSSSGMQVWERPMTPIADFAKKIYDVELMKDGAEKGEALKKLQEEMRAAGMDAKSRIFVGRTEKNDAVILLSDRNGKPRIRMQVDEANVPSLQFLDENGKVTHRLPENAPGSHN